MSLGRGFVAVTPSDSVDIARDARGEFPGALRFGTGGTASVVGSDGTVVTLINIADGEVFDSRVRRVNATGTTASDIVGIYI